MKNRAYLLMTVLFGILSFSPSEARIMDSDAGETIGTPSWSVTIPVKNDLTIAQPMVVAEQISLNFSEIKTKTNDKSRGDSAKEAVVRNLDNDPLTKNAPLLPKN